MPAPSASSAGFDKTDVLEKAARLVRRGDLDAAIREYAKLFELNPRDLTIGNTLGDLYLKTGANDKAAVQFMKLAAQLVDDGFEAKARALYKKVLRLQPNHEAARQRMEELETRQAERTTPFLKRVLETAGAARAASRATHPARESSSGDDSGLEIVDFVSALSDAAAHAPIPQPVRPVQVVPPPRSAAPSPPPPPAPAPVPVAPMPPPPPPMREAIADADEWTAIDLSADAALSARVDEMAPVVEHFAAPPIAKRDFSDAVAAIDRALDDGPAESAEIAALEHAIDAGVDAGDDPRTIEAQLRLGDVCLTAQLYERARNIADDLLARQPDVVEHQQLLDRVIAASSGRVVRHAPPPRREAQPFIEVALRAEPSTTEAFRAVASGDVTGLIADEHPSIHDSDDDLLAESADEDLVFDAVRTTVVADAEAAADALIAEAERAARANRFDEAAAALEEAMCTPRLRAAAGSRFAHLMLDHGLPLDAMACLEWVAEVPPTSEEGAHRLAYDLAITLEALGEQAQALGVYRELLAEAGASYRDVAVRAERLAAA